MDATLGGGGYAAAILPILNKKGRYIGVDRDEDAVQHSRSRFPVSETRFIARQGQLAQLNEVLKEEKISRIDGLLLDLGVSSYQIDTAERGFGYLEEGPLDMRMDRSSGKDASFVINEYSEKELADTLYKYGEERRSRQIARAIIASREANPINTTLELAAVIRRMTPRPHQIKTLARVWQALRFEVNGELDQLRKGLERSYPLLKSGGRMVVLSYESLMDRMVKRFFRGQEPLFSRFEEPGTVPEYSFTILTKKVVRSSVQEIAGNPRARSARLRAAEKKEKG